MSDNKELWQRGQNLYRNLSAEVESQEELVTLLEIAKMQAYREVNMFDISKGNHLGYTTQDNQETDSKEA